jgi:hypothetical protein
MNTRVTTSIGRPFLRSVFILAVFALNSFALSPGAQAVSPAPDGGYPGGNTAEGQSALLSLTTGTYNTAVGLYSLLSLTSGNFCTGIGAGTLLLNTADQNTATGAGALLSNATGINNMANGAFALFSNTTGSDNTATGVEALFGNTTGSGNTATGRSALFSNISGGDNTATGIEALRSNTTGSDNTASGHFALSSNIDGSNNTATGLYALLSNTSGTDNTATGNGALDNNTSGSNNTAAGANALAFNSEGFENTAIGIQALLHNTGSGNTALGYLAGSNLTTGDDNIDIGNDGAAGDGGVIRIGRSFINATFIAGISGVTISGGAAVFVNSDGQLGTSTSSRRFKDQIKPMDKASEALFALNPVTFHYKKEIDPTGTSQFGLVAEEVEKINPDLVVRDGKGQVNTVRYDQVNAMLLNEFLKEHRKVQEEEVTIAELRKEMEAVVVRLKEHDSRIQKVSAQIEMGNPRPQIVQNR